MISNLRKTYNVNGIDYKEITINDNENLDLTIKYTGTNDTKRKTLYHPFNPVNIIKFLGTDSGVEELYNKCNEYYKFNKTFDGCVDYIYNGFYMNEA